MDLPVNKTEAVNKVLDSNMSPVNLDTVKVSEHFTLDDFDVGEDGGVFVRQVALLRVFKKLYTIFAVDSEVMNPGDPSKSAIVTVTYEFCKKMDNAETCRGLLLRWSGSADAHSNNSAKGFGSYYTAFAETRASARALRSILGVEVCSSEEPKTSFESSNNNPIQDNQKVLIETKFMGERKVTLEEICELVNRQIKSVSELSYTEAADLIQALNKKKRSK